MGLALLPDLVLVQDVLAAALEAPPGTRLPADSEATTTCRTCGEEQTLADAHVTGEEGDTIYTCRHGCQRLVVVSAPGSTAWPGRGYRHGAHVIRNASDLYLTLPGATKQVLITASPEALKKGPPPG